LPYQQGRSRTWLKVKNREHPAMQREWEQDWRRRQSSLG
jgi:hypothetical protein